MSSNFGATASAAPATTSTASTSGFIFGAAPRAQAPTAAPNCRAAAPATTSTVSTSGFIFGAAAPRAQAPTAAPIGFSFGAPATTSTASTSGSIFGAAAPRAQAPTPIGFSFGATVPPTTSTASASGSIFGAAAPRAQAPTAAPAGIIFGAPRTAAAPVAVGSAVRTTTTATRVGTVIGRQDELSSGFDESIFITKPLEKCMCSLCLNVLNDPSQCPNGHCFCHGCIQQALKAKRECPMCKVHLTVDKLSKSLFVKDLIQELPTKCKTLDSATDSASSSETCQWVGPLYSRESHYKKCGYVLMPCGNFPCLMKIPRKDADIHAAECPMRVVMCEDCDTPVVFSVKQQHMKDCQGRIVTCPIGCGERLHSKKVPAHTVVCPMERVECPIAALGACPGCTGTVTRGSLKEHIMSGESLSAIVKSVVDLKRKNEELKDENKALQSQVSHLSCRFDGLSWEMRNKIDTFLANQSAEKTEAECSSNRRLVLSMLGTSPLTAQSKVTLKSWMDDGLLSRTAIKALADSIAVTSIENMGYFAQHVPFEFDLTERTTKVRFKVGTGVVLTQDYTEWEVVVAKTHSTQIVDFSAGPFNLPSTAVECSNPTCKFRMSLTLLCHPSSSAECHKFTVGPWKFHDLVNRGGRLCEKPLEEEEFARCLAPNNTSVRALLTVIVFS